MKRLLALLIPAVLLGGVIVWRLQTKKAEAAEQAKVREARKNTVPTVTVAEAKQRDIIKTFEGVATIETPYNVKISSKVTGQILNLDIFDETGKRIGEAREGMHVKAGWRVGQIDSRQVMAAVNQAQAEVSRQQSSLAEARQRLAQAQLTQIPTNTTVDTNIRQQEATLNSAIADARQTRENYTSQKAVAASAVTDTQGRINSAEAAIANADAGIASAQANVDNARTKYNRTNDLYKQGFIAAQDVDDARTTLNVQLATLEVAKGQKQSAIAARDSARAQKQGAKEQLDIVTEKGKADITAAEARVTQARAALAAAKSNRAQKPAYQRNIDALKSTVTASEFGVQSAEAALRNVQAQLRDTTLNSSVDGYITGRYLDPGAIATPGQQILAIQALKQVYATVPVPEEVSSKIHLGDTGTLTVDALPGQTFTGKVTQINPSADTSSRQFSTRITIDNPKDLLKPGMFGRVKFEIEHIKDAVVVPREAIQKSPQGATLVVVDEQSNAQRRPVKTGESDTQGIAVLDGVVKPGEKVVVMSLTPVKDGPVKVSDAKPEQKSGGEGGVPAGGAPAGGASQDNTPAGNPPPPGTTVPSGGGGSAPAGTSSTPR